MFRLLQLSFYFRDARQQAAALDVEFAAALCSDGGEELCLELLELLAHKGVRALRLAGGIKCNTVRVRGRGNIRGRRQITLPFSFLVTKDRD